MTAKTNDTAKRLADIAARAEAATPGPWGRCINARGSSFYIEIPGAYKRKESPWCLAEASWGGPMPEREQADSNTIFIANAREHIPYLLSIIAERDAEIERLRVIVRVNALRHGATNEEIDRVIQDD